MDLGGRREINLYRLVYRSGINSKVAEAWIKAPYGAVFALTDMLTRRLSQGDLRWFRLAAMTNDQIRERRSELVRPMEALRATTLRTKVVWDE